LIFINTKKPKKKTLCSDEHSVFFCLPLPFAASAAGADGVMVEVHNDPACALCDGAQSLTPEQFADMMKSVSVVRNALREAL
jgi:3-deoxy-D-arabino-heptulosonate 7-phosphate (DAHP) synthase